MKRDGVFIAISGLDGSGKTTVQNKIRDILSDLTSKEILCIDGLKPLKYTNVLRAYAEKEQQDVFELFGDISLFSFALSLMDNYVNQIKPALEEGRIVITHRNDLCCKAYTKLRDYNHSVIPILNEIIKSYPKADLHLYCDSSVETVMERILERTKSGYQPSINENYHHLTQAKEYYEELILHEYSYIERLDTSSSNKERLYQSLQDILERKIAGKL